ncbi:hypothetical protein [Oceanibium sediminis]|uniref:hypothetical protein n=1 Tax=Oceanibium sediminis TaxID=2026339 RepID=UPI000DD3B9B3|nr:hypothetical protein [Oceanibium sediminis]
MTRILTITLCLVFSAAAASAAAADGRSQLAASLGLSAEQASQLSTAQLALLKHVADSSTISEADKRRRIKAILNGAAPRFQFNF